jgi:hypothetical protein
MSLKELKKKLSINQMNILVCEVVSDFDSYTNVRTPTGSTVRASKTSGLSFEKGSMVEVRTDRNIYTVVGDSSYSEYSAERVYPL